MTTSILGPITIVAALRTAARRLTTEGETHDVKQVESPPLCCIVGIASQIGRAAVYLGELDVVTSRRGAMA